MSSDPSRLIAALARDRIILDLKTLDLCFLRADRASLASFEEDVLIDMFMQICDVVDRGAERPRKRASLIGERGFDGFGRCWGVFSHAYFIPPFRWLCPSRRVDAASACVTRINHLVVDLANYGALRNTPLSEGIHSHLSSLFSWLSVRDLSACIRIPNFVTALDIEYFMAWFCVHHFMARFCVRHFSAILAVRISGRNNHKNACKQPVQ